MTEKKGRFHGPGPACWQNGPCRGPALSLSGPTGPTGPSACLGVGVGKGALHQVSEETRRRVVGKGSQEKPQATNDFKVKSREIKKKKRQCVFVLEIGSWTD